MEAETTRERTVQPTAIASAAGAVAAAFPGESLLAYGPQGRWRIAAGARRALVVRSSEVAAGWELIREALRAHPGEAAYGYFAFDLVAARMPYPQCVGEAPVAYLFWPEVELVASPSETLVVGAPTAVDAVVRAIEAGARPPEPEQPPPRSFPSLADDAEASTDEFDGGALDLEATSGGKVRSFIHVVEAAKRAIEAGRATKVIVRRERRIHSPLHPVLALEEVSKNAAARHYAVVTPHVRAVGSSPAVLAHVDGREFWSEALAGTYPRGPRSTRDEARAWFMRNAKEVHEHALTAHAILADVEKVAKHGRAVLDRFLEVLEFPTTYHLGVRARCELAADFDEVDAVASVFPGVTCTGVPRAAAVALIGELEDTRRGFYGGSVGYFDGHGGADWSLSLRGATGDATTTVMHAGAAIGIYSDPEEESLESLHKMLAVARRLAR